MANPHRGEATIHLDGEPTPRTLVVDFNAIAEVVDELEIPFDEIGGLADRQSYKVLKFVRSVVAAGLSRGRKRMSAQEAGLLISEHFDQFGEITEAAFTAVGRFFHGAEPPKPPEVADAPLPPTPPAAPAVALVEPAKLAG